MATRGPYSKGKIKRAEILDTALAVIARDGYSGATVKNLADAVELSPNGLLHYFGSKDALFIEIVQRQDEVTGAQVDHPNVDYAEGLTARLVEAAADETAAPGILQLLIRLTGEATEPGHDAHAYFRNRYATIRRFLAAAVRSLQESERMDPDADPDAIAALVMAGWDGLRIQWMYDKTVDIRGGLTYLLNSLGMPHEPEPPESE